MPLDTVKIEKLIERAEDVRGMTFGRNQNAAPLSEDDKLEDLPKELQPSASMLPIVRTAIGYKLPNMTSWDRYKDYELVTNPKSNFEHRTYDGQLTLMHGNYRELVTKLLQENPVKNPACYRVFYSTESRRPTVRVSEWPIYAGDDIEMARGLICSLKRVRVINSALCSSLQGDPLISTHGGHRFEYTAASKGKVRDLTVKRKQKGQLPFHMVRDLFWSMREAMNTVACKAAFSLVNHYLGDRTFCGYADRVYLAYPLLTFMTKRRDRKEFAVKLKEIAPYVPGMLKSKVPGRAAFAKWVQKALRKER